MTEMVQELDRSERRWLWLGLLGGPVIYSLHFLIVYFLVEAACRANLLRFEVLGLNGISFWVALLTLAAALATAYTAWAAYRTWQRLRGADKVRLEGTPALLALSGLWLSGGFTLLILLTGLPALVLTVCDWI